MCERTSAGELEARYLIKHALMDFTDQMKAALYDCIPDKGMSWRNNKVCSVQYLKKKLLEAFEAGEWVSVANYAFMLDDKEQRKEAGQ